MPYVQRDAQGKIVGTFMNRQQGYAEEFVASVAPPPAAVEDDVDDAPINFQVLALMFREYCNALAAGTYTPKTPQDLKDDFRRLHAVVKARFQAKLPGG